MKKKFIIPLLVILLTVFIVFVYPKWYGVKEKAEHLEATGIIEATEVNVSPKISERIEWLCCREGDVVKRGDTLIRLDNREVMAKLNEGKAALQGAEAGYNVSQANLENARARVESAKAELKAAESEVDRARALFQEARDNFQRISELFSQGYATQRDRDAAKAAHDATQAQFNTAVARKQSLRAALTTAMAGIKAAEAQVTSAKATIGEAEARLKLIETQSKDTEVLSPIDGVIAYKSYEAGEMVSSGKPIYTLYDLKTLWARIDIEETEIGRIKLGERAIIMAEASTDKGYDGEVIEIGIEAEFATQRDVTRGRQDIKTFRVKVAVNKPEGFLKPGMTVMVRFNVRNRNQ